MYAHRAFNDTSLLQFAETAWHDISLYQISEDDAKMGTHHQRNVSIASTCNGCELVYLLLPFCNANGIIATMAGGVFNIVSS
jgi:hypothetical protein